MKVSFRIRAPKWPFVFESIRFLKLKVKLGTQWGFKCVLQVLFDLKPQ